MSKIQKIKIFFLQIKKIIQILKLATKNKNNNKNKQINQIKSN